MKQVNYSVALRRTKKRRGKAWARGYAMLRRIHRELGRKDCVPVEELAS